MLHLLQHEHKHKLLPYSWGISPPLALIILSSSALYLYCHCAKQPEYLHVLDHSLLPWNLTYLIFRTCSTFGHIPHTIPVWFQIGFTIFTLDGYFERRQKVVWWIPNCPLSMEHAWERLLLLTTTWYIFIHACGFIKCVWRKVAYTFSIFLLCCPLRCLWLLNVDRLLFLGVWEEGGRG